MHKVRIKYDPILVALLWHTYLVKASDEETASLLLVVCMVHYCSNCLAHYCHIYTHYAALHETEQQGWCRNWTSWVLLQLWYSRYRYASCHSETKPLSNTQQDWQCILHIISKHHICTYIQGFFWWYTMVSCTDPLFSYSINIKGSYETCSKVHEVLWYLSPLYTFLRAMQFLPFEGLFYAKGAL